jgi:mannose-6-phosphate isomerase-like protein (cupin superfamily)
MTVSYPEPRYLGEGGEASATMRPASQAPDLIRPTHTVGYLATGASTHGQFGLYRWDFTGEPSGPAPHFHRTISESFFVLSGAVRLYDGREWLTATSGDFLYVPEGGIHGFRNESGEPASMLILFAPGAPREPYFENVSKAADMTEEERAAFMLAHDTFWT